MPKKTNANDRTEESRVQGFKALAESAKSNRSCLEDIDGEHRRWNELSAQGKIQNLAAVALYNNAPFAAFAQEVRDTLSPLPPAAREEAALRVAFHNQGELHQIEKLLPKHDRLEPYPVVEQVRDTLADYRETVAELEGAATIGRAFKETVVQTVRQQEDKHGTHKDQLFAASVPAPTPTTDPSFYAHVEPVLTELEAFGDAFERTARTAEERQLAAHFKDWIHNTSRAFSIPGAQTLAEKLYGAARPQPESPGSPGNTHERQHAR